MAGMWGRECFEALSFSGFDPRIHDETSKVPVTRWIAGSKSGNDKRTSTVILNAVKNPN